jgi:hypothetical protein
MWHSWGTVFMFMHRLYKLDKEQVLLIQALFKFRKGVSTQNAFFKPSSICSKLFFYNCTSNSHPTFLAKLSLNHFLHFKRMNTAPSS